MTTAAKRYRIECGCGAAMFVGPGNAGGQVICDRCRGALAVPRLRDLEPFAVAEPASPARRWRPAQGWLLAGTVVAALAGVAALLTPTLLGGGPPHLADEATIRAAIESVDAATIYQAWQAMRGSGVDRGTLPEELRLQQAAGAAGRIAAVLWAVAFAGAVVAAAGGLGCLFGQRTPPAAHAAQGHSR
ncbi:MAG: hypothetical protein ACKO1M_10430 [Planctomycetota bacterium]